MKKYILPALGVGALLTAALIGPIANQVVKGAVDVYFLVPHQDKDTVEINEFMFDAKPADPDYDKKVMQIYGVPSSEKERVLVDASLIKEAKQKPGLKWLVLEGERPLQAKTVLFVAGLLRGGAVEVAMLFLVVFLLLRLGSPAPGARSPAAGH